MNILKFIRKLSKKNVIIILVIINLLGVVIGIAYSTYRSSNTNNIEIGSVAKIVFNNQVTQTLSLPSYGLMPGENADYLFKVSNYNNGVRSDVNIDYSIRIESFHLLPTEIKLYSVGNTEQLILTCNEETGQRNEEHKLVCLSSSSTLYYSSDDEHNYKIEINFPLKDGSGNLWSSDYSEVLDYVDITVISNQKTD